MYISVDNKAWLAAYLYYSEPWEDILTKSLAPFAKAILDEGLAEEFFFIRYWERGPHIRLRFKGEENVLEEQVKPRLEQHFQAYFNEHPSERQEPEWLKAAPAENQWYPNNSIQFIDYEPETPRYGGDTCLIISERQFQASSEAILAIIEESDSWDYGRALGAAIQMHLGFAYALGMDHEEATAFYNRVFENWLPRAYYFFEKDVDQEELEQRKKETLEAFEKNFEEQKENLLPFFDTVWEALQEGQEFEQEWLNQWVKDIQEVCAALKDAQKQGKMEVPKWYRHDKTATEIATEKRERWAIYDSYIHMINNRLGILNRDEGYLGYLMKESFKATVQ